MLADLIKATIRLVMSNYSLSFFVLGLIVSLAAIARSGSSTDRPLVVKKLLAWYVLFSIGVDNFYNFVMHVFFGEMSAAFIGWADSPFQFEVGTASLSYAAVGLLAAFRSYDLRLAAVLGPKYLHAPRFRKEPNVAQHDFGMHIAIWRSLGELNPCFSLERAAS